MRACLGVHASNTYKTRWSLLFGLRESSEWLYKNEGRICGLFYVQDKLYNAVPWMAWSVDVQDEQPEFCSRHIPSTYIHVSNNAVPWMAKSVEILNKRF